MEKQDDLFQNLSPEERIPALESMATKSEMQAVKRPYSDDEKDQAKTFVTEESIIIMDKDAEFKKIAKEFRDAISKAKANVLGALKDVKRGYSQSEETVYMIADQETGIMNTFDSKGIHIGSRKLFPDERQTKIIDMEQRTGTHD